MMLVALSFYVWVGFDKGVSKVTKEVAAVAAAAAMEEERGGIWSHES